MSVAKSVALIKKPSRFSFELFSRFAWRLTVIEPNEWLHEMEAVFPCIQTDPQPCDFLSFPIIPCCITGTKVPKNSGKHNEHKINLLRLHLSTFKPHDNGCDAVVEIVSTSHQMTCVRALEITVFNTSCQTKELSPSGHPAHLWPGLSECVSQKEYSHDLS